MKKRLLATVCALALVAGMALTAVAAPSPATQQLIAANTDIEVAYEGSTVAVDAASAKEVSVASSPAALTVAVLEGVQAVVSEAKSDDFSVATVAMTNVKSEADTTIALSVADITNADAVKVLAYNKVTGFWDYIPAVTTNGHVYMLTSAKYTAVVIMKVGVVPEGQRFNASATTSEVTESLVLGGKDETTSVVISTDAMTAPFTGETNVSLLVFAAIAFAGVFAVAGKKALA